MFLGRGTLTNDVRTLSPFFSPNTVLPEMFVETKISADVDDGKHIFWLGLGHYYDLSADWAIAEVKKNGEPTTDWEKPLPRKIGSGTAPLSRRENDVNRTLANLVWWIELKDDKAASWEVTLRERYILFNPLRISTVRTDGDASTDFDTTVRWLHSGGVSLGTSYKANVNAIAIWGIPDGYEIELWGIRYRRLNRGGGQTRLQRGRIWRPWLRIAPTEKRSGMNVVIIPKLWLETSKRFLGVSLYNPNTFARSVIRPIGQAGRKGSNRLNRFIHAFL